MAQLRDYTKSWWLLVPFNFKLGQWFAEKGLSTFAVIPVASPGLKHIRYTTIDLFELLSATKLKPRGVDGPTFRANSSQYWWQHLALSDNNQFGQLNWDTGEVVPHNGTSFGFSFTTNGIAACVLMDRLKPKEPEAVDPVRPPMSNRVIGIDPGVVNFVGAVALDINTEDNTAVESNFLLSSVRFKEDWCGERAR